MATRTDVLRIKLEQTGDGQVKASIAGVSNDVKKLEDQTERSSASAARFKGALIALAGALSVSAVVRTIVEFDRLNAMLKTVTGSSEAAAFEFNKLKQFAAETPFQLDEVVGAFIKLKALGLDPSQEALRSYGNTAAAMGKNLNQFIEAVADAATGEFERLKEFGIKARTQGDQVAFTFRNQTTVVRKSAQEIEGYLRRIGQNEFATGMADQMNTLGGQFSNLQDAASQLANAIGELGLTQVLRGLTAAAINAANGIRSLLEQMRGDRTANVIQVQIDALNERLAALNNSADYFNQRGIQIPQQVQQQLEAARARLAELKKELDDLNNAAPPIGLPNVQPAGGSIADPFGGDDKKAQQAAEREAQRWQQRLEAFRRAQLTEQELIIQAETEKEAIIHEFWNRGLIGHEEYFNSLEQIERESAERRKAIEDDVNQTILQGRFNVYQQVVGLLRTFAGESKTAAIAALLIEKAIAAKQVIIQSEVAAAKARAALIIPGNPASVAYAEAQAQRIRAQGQIAAALIAATGLAQASQIGSGGASAGSAANPIYTQPVTQQPNSSATARGEQVINIIFEGPVYGQDDFDRRIAESVERYTDLDNPVMRSTSRNAIDIRSG